MNAFSCTDILNDIIDHTVHYLITHRKLPLTEYLNNILTVSDNNTFVYNMMILNDRKSYYKNSTMVWQITLAIIVKVTSKSYKNLCSNIILHTHKLTQHAHKK